MAQALLDLIKTHFAAQVKGSHAQHGDETVIVEPSAWLAVHRFLRDEAGCNMLTDLTAVDFPDREPRFEIVSHVHSLSKGQRLRVKTAVGDGNASDAV